MKGPAYQMIASGEPCVRIKLWIKPHLSPQTRSMTEIPLLRWMTLLGQATSPCMIQHDHPKTGTATGHVTHTRDSRAVIHRHTRNVHSTMVLLVVLNCKRHQQLEAARRTCCMCFDLASMCAV